MDHRKITIGMAVVDKMELLLSPEPKKAAQPRSGKSSLNAFEKAGAPS
jgi:hypothetical protein